MDQLEGRNPVIECLQRGRRRVARVWLDEGAKPDARIERVLELAHRRGVTVSRVPRGKLDRMAEGRVHNGIIAEAEPLFQWKTGALLDDLFSRRVDPFLVLVNEVAYEHNLGAILRSSLGFGAHAVILPSHGGAGATPVVQRVSMGAIEEVPVVREGLTAALKPIRKAGIRVLGADMGGRSPQEIDLTGPLAFVLGGEGHGLSGTLRRLCDDVVGIPLAGGLESLNVSVAAAVLMYEKRRQDGWFSPGAPDGSP